MKLALCCAAALLASAAAQATCIPPPPDAFTTPGLTGGVPPKVGDDALLPTRRPLTNAGTDYYCPMPIELGLAYRIYNYQSTAVVHGLLDEQIQQAGLPLTPGPTAPAWDAATVYLQGQQVSYDGATYEAQWWTQGEQPGASVYGAWRPVDNGVASTWSGSRAYQAGEKAVYDNKVWQARWWTQGEQPGSNEWGAWQATNDPVPPPAVPLPSRYSASLNWANGEITVTLQSVNGAINGRPAYVEVREQGVPLGRITQFPLLYRDCFGAPECQPGAYWTGGAKFVSTKLPGAAWISLWACNAQDVCRPAELTRWVYGQTTNGNPSEPFPLEGDPRLSP
ncbi:hypothetical protein GCM10007860_23200 [Chitiniphilus shinanonensis]|uniref:Chitin-binding type-3 domain-containing protein n=1 Tax=Chitiniphilus shinanonensis TaxID=553088 RepID=A0ABQ6BT36_9NEIS|nr:carbohydrate-binding protein [Chitiniphilus shinanonensis]GLS05170.1 hypothetical protein GCM10007860_23200 [Chitiniphilus shinanonensis]